MSKKLYGNKNIIIFVIVGLLAILAVLIVKNKTDLKKYNEKGKEFFYASNFEEAIKAYESIYNNEKQSAIWPAKISEIYLLQDDKESADSYMKEALEREDKTGEANAIILNNQFIKLKEKYVQNKATKEDYENIINSAEEKVKKYPDNDEIKKITFAIYLFVNDKTKANDIKNQYITNESTAYEFCEKAMMEFELRDIENGMKTLKAAYDLDRDELKIYDTVYKAYIIENNVLDEILELSNNNEDELSYKLWLAKIYASNVNLNKSEQLLNEISTNKEIKNFIIPSLIRMELLTNKDEIDQAEELLKTLLKDYSDDYRVNYIASYHWFKKNDIEKSMKYFRTTIKQNEKYLPLYTNLAPSILEMKGEQNKAISYLHHATYEEPYNSLIYINNGFYSLYSMNNSVVALKNFKIAQVFDRDNLELKYQTALIYLSNHSYNEAIDMLKKCIEKDDKSIKYHRTLGTTYVLAKENDKAIQEINKAYELDKSNILTLNNLGCYYITVESDLDKGFKYIESAFKGIKQSHDEYTIETITENYNKIVELKKKYETGKENEVIEIPDFIMFY
ncbi:MAG: tetratricopeptide repeat protein [Clostridium sp.]